MQSSIEFVFVLSRAMAEYEKEKLEKFVKDLFAKFGKEKDSLKNLEVHYDRIFLEYSAEKTLAHRILPKIVKEFENFLNEFKIGLRDCYVKRYELLLNVKNEGIKDIKVPFMKSCKVVDDKLTLVLEFLDYSFFSKGCMDRLLKLLKEKVEGKDKKIIETIEISDIKKDLKNGKEILNLYSCGNILLPEISKIYSKLKRYVEENLHKNSFDNIVLSRSIRKKDISKLGKLNIDLTKLSFLYVFNDSDNNIERIIDKFKILRELDEEEMKKSLKLKDILNLGYLTLCIPFSSKIISKESIPVKIYTNLEKEIVGIIMSYPYDADNFMQELVNFFRDILKKQGLDYRVKKTSNKIELESKSKKNKWISIFKIIVNKDIGKSLNIKTNNSYLSCIGFEIDLENLLISYLAHYPEVKKEKKIKIL